MRQKDTQKNARMAPKRIVALVVSAAVFVGSIVTIALHVGDDTPLVCLLCVVPNVLALFGLLYTLFPKAMRGGGVRRVAGRREEGEKREDNGLSFAAWLPAVVAIGVCKGLFGKRKKGRGK